MSNYITLPKPLSTELIAPGQIISDPSTGQAFSSIFSSVTTSGLSYMYPEHQTITTHAAHSDYIPASDPTNQLKRKDSVVLSVEEPSQISLAQPRLSFNDLRRDVNTRFLLRKAALQHLPLYYVTGIQVLSDSSPARTTVDEGVVAEVSEGATRLPMHVMQPTSAAVTDDTNCAKTSKDGNIFAVELLRVKCRVGAVDEPHDVDDIDYDWSYHALDEDLQLSIGLGKVFRPSELRSRDGVEPSEDSTDDWDSQSDYDDDSGLGGF